MALMLNSMKALFLFHEGKTLPLLRERMAETQSSGAGAPAARRSAIRRLRRIVREPRAHVLAHPLRTRALVVAHLRRQGVHERAVLLRRERLDQVEHLAVDDLVARERLAEDRHRGRRGSDHRRRRPIYARAQKHSGHLAVP